MYVHDITVDKNTISAFLSHLEIVKDVIKEILRRNLSCVGGNFILF